MVKKIISVCLALTIFLSLNAFALTTSEILNSKNSNTLVLGVNAGIMTIGTMETSGSDTYIKLKSVVHGQMADISILNVGFRYDKTKVTLVDENNTPIAAAGATIMKKLFTGVVVDDIKWGLSTKFNASGAQYAYVSYGVYSKVATEKYALAAGSTADFTEAKFKVNAGSSTAASDVMGYFNYTGSSKAYTAIGAPGATGAFGIYPVLETTAAAATLKTDEPFSFDWQLAAPANTITANITGKGKVFIDNAPYAGKVTLAEGVSAAAIKIIPNLGYTVETATLTGVAGNIVDPIGGTYNATVSGDATLTVTFVPVAETIGANKPMPSQKIFTETKDVGGVQKKANTTFAAAPTSGIVECGIYLEKDGAAYTKFGGPYFKSDNTNANGQYGIEFVGFEIGEYTATPYVRYTSATETPTLAGSSVAFSVK